MDERDSIEEFIDRVVSSANLGSAEADEVRRELRSHFEEAGPSPEARQEALRRFGHERLVARGLRSAHGVDPDGEPWRRPSFVRLVRGAIRREVSHMLHDLRFGIRILLRNPAFSIIALLCLMVGIGANTAVFGWVEGILLRPFAGVSDQDQIVAMSGASRGETGSTEVSWPDFLDFQRNTSFAAAFIADKIMGATLNFGDRAQRVTGSVVSANYFTALGVHMALGRGFEPGEDSGENAHRVVVISHQLWQEQFGSDPNIVGRAQRLNGLEHTIVGVAPKGFVGTFVGYAMQLWVPASMEENFENGGYKLEDRGARWIEGFVRLKPGVPLGRAQTEMAAVSARLQAEYPATNRGRSVTVVPLWQTPFNKANELRSTLAILACVAAFVLLIVCANVGNLLLVRALARRREMTVRLAIGAGRGRLVRQLITEGLLLTILAAIGGILVAYWCQHALAWFFPYPVSLPAEIDWRVLALSAAVTLTSTFVLGLVPALQTRRLDLVDSLRSESAAVVGGLGRSWIRSGLVLVQVSLSFALLAGAALLIKSLNKIENTDPGFATDGVLSTFVDLSGAGYDADRAKTFLNTLIDRVRALPGVESAVLCRVLPLGLLPFSSAPVAIDGYVPGVDEQPTVSYNQVGPGYFATVGIPLLSGREFTTADNETSQPVVIVNEPMAAKYWGGRNPIGTRLVLKNRSFEVVGVARLSRYYSLREPARPFFYVPLRQDFSARVVLSVKTRRQTADVASALTATIRSLDPTLVAYDVVTVRDRIARATSSERIAVTLLIGFGALALVLAAVGLYGVMSCVVSQSTREMGLRLSLGASTTDVFGQVLAKGAVLTGVGLVVGAMATLGLARYGAGLLYHVRPTDPLAFGAAAVALIAAALLACAVPAWQAAGIDPIEALRS